MELDVTLLEAHQPPALNGIECEQRVGEPGTAVQVNADRRTRKHVTCKPERSAAPGMKLHYAYITTANNDDNNFNSNKNNIDEKVQ